MNCQISVFLVTYVTVTVYFVFALQIQCDFAIYLHPCAKERQQKIDEHFLKPCLVETPNLTFEIAPPYRFRENSDAILGALGADVNAANERGKTALMRGEGSFDKLRVLIEHGANVKVKDNYGNSVLLIAAAQNYNSGISSNDYYCKIAEYLLKCGASPNAKESRRGCTPLHFAVVSKNQGFVASLLSAGADIDAQNSQGDTALMGAVRLELMEMTSLLLQRGADVNATNAAGETALFIAGQCETTDAMCVLLEAGAGDVNTVDTE